ncbi:MAG: HAD-IA family hydrolase [Rhodococcus sp. (in: high G+C Gram-positive bacteria)]
MSAILFGSISTLADTSELQRRAFNEAFSTHGLDWNWSREDYVSMLGSNGGAQRIEGYAADRGADVDAAAVHATKSEIFRALIASSGISPRPGVVATIEAAKKNDTKLGFVTTTSKENVTAILAALSPKVSAEVFDVLVDGEDVSEGKPDPASYAFALDRLGESAQSCVAIEDNEGGVAAAVAADIACVAFPNENTSSGDFSAATETVESLDPARLESLATARS